VRSSIFSMIEPDVTIPVAEATGLDVPPPSSAAEPLRQFQSLWERAKAHQLRLILMETFLVTMMTILHTIRIHGSKYQVPQSVPSVCHTRTMCAHSVYHPCHPDTTNVPSAYTDGTQIGKEVNVFGPKHVPMRTDLT